MSFNENPSRIPWRVILRPNLHEWKLLWRNTKKYATPKWIKSRARSKSLPFGSVTDHSNLKYIGLDISNNIDYTLIDAQAYLQFFKSSPYVIHTGSDSSRWECVFCGITVDHVGLPDFFEVYPR